MTQESPRPSLAPYPELPVSDLLAGGGRDLARAHRPGRRDQRRRVHLRPGLGGLAGGGPGPAGRGRRARRPGRHRGPQLPRVGRRLPRRPARRGHRHDPEPALQGAGDRPPVRRLRAQGRLRRRRHRGDDPGRLGPRRPVPPHRRRLGPGRRCAGEPDAGRDRPDDRPGRPPLLVGHHRGAEGRDAAPPQHHQQRGPDPGDRPHPRRLGDDRLPALLPHLRPDRADALRAGQRVQAGGAARLRPPALRRPDPAPPGHQPLRRAARRSWPWPTWATSSGPTSAASATSCRAPRPCRSTSPAGWPSTTTSRSSRATA